MQKGDDVWSWRDPLKSGHGKAHFGKMVVRAERDFRIGEKIGPYSSETAEDYKWVPHVKLTQDKKLANLSGKVKDEKIYFSVLRTIKKYDEFCVWMEPDIEAIHSAITYEDSSEIIDALDRIKISNVFSLAQIEITNVLSLDVNQVFSFPKEVQVVAFDVERNDKLKSLPDFGQLAREAEASNSKPSLRKRSRNEKVTGAAMRENSSSKTPSKRPLEQLNNTASTELQHKEIVAASNLILSTGEQPKRKRGRPRKNFKSVLSVIQPQQKRRQTKNKKKRSWSEKVTGTAMTENSSSKTPSKRPLKQLNNTASTELQHKEIVAASNLILSTGEQPKRKRGRPRKNFKSVLSVVQPQQKQGRPKKSIKTSQSNSHPSTKKLQSKQMPCQPGLRKSSRKTKIVNYNHSSRRSKRTTRRKSAEENEEKSIYAEATSNHQENLGHMRCTENNENFPPSFQLDEVKEVMEFMLQEVCKENDDTVILEVKAVPKEEDEDRFQSEPQKVKEWECEKCSRKFCAKGHLLAHYITQHQESLGNRKKQKKEIFNFVCNECGKRYKYKESILFHKCSKKTKTKEFEHSTLKRKF